jgi:corrinoid protein of di/trimethylamine methyltransferase
VHVDLDEDKLRRHRAFLKREPVERPLVGSWLFGFFIDQQYPSVAGAMEPGHIEPEDIPIDLFLEDVDVLWKAYTELDDDYPLSMGAFYGVPWLEAIMGCPIKFSGTTMWADPCIAEWDQYDWQAPRLEENPWALKLLEFLETLVEHSDGRFACGPTLMRGPADMCAAMRGAGQLGLDLYDHPEEVRRLAAICADVWIEVGRAQLELVPESEEGYLVGCSGLRCWMPEKGIWLQDDAVSSALSPSFYENIFIPQVRRIASAFPMVAFHLHGNYLWPVELLLQVDEIDVLELGYDVGVCDLEEVMRGWHMIQEKKPCIAYADATLEEFQWILDRLSPTGLSLQTLSPTIEEGQALRDLVYARAGLETVSRPLDTIESVAEAAAKPAPTGVEEALFVAPHLSEITFSVIEGRQEETRAAVDRALDAGYGAEELLQEALIPAMNEVGRRFEEEECFVPEMMMAARAMKVSLALLQPMLASGGSKSVGKVVIGTVKGDLHDIGKNLVAVMLEGQGFEVEDLGVDVSIDEFLEAVKEHQPDFLGLSTLLTTTMPEVERVIEALVETGIRDDVKVMVGGAPVTASWVEQIGGDLYAPDAARAARIAKVAVTG